jgi:hypothetical protein
MPTEELGSYPVPFGTVLQRELQDIQRRREPPGPAEPAAGAATPRAAGDNPGAGREPAHEAAPAPKGAALPPGWKALLAAFPRVLEGMEATLQAAQRGAIEAAWTEIVPALRPYARDVVRGVTAKKTQKDVVDKDWQRILDDRRRQAVSEAVRTVLAKVGQAAAGDRPGSEGAPAPAPEVAVEQTRPPTPEANGAQAVAGESRLLKEVAQRTLDILEKRDWHISLTEVEGMVSQRATAEALQALWDRYEKSDNEADRKTAKEAYQAARSALTTEELAGLLGAAQLQAILEATEKALQEAKKDRTLSDLQLADDARATVLRAAWDANAKTPLAYFCRDIEQTAHNEAKARARESLWDQATTEVRTEMLSQVRRPLACQTWQESFQKVWRQAVRDALRQTLAEREYNQLCDQIQAPVWDRIPAHDRAGWEKYLAGRWRKAQAKLKKSKEAAAEALTQAMTRVLTEAYDRHLRSACAGLLEKAWGQIVLEMEEEVLRNARTQALSMDLVGLSFSGGGIRSATFNLGVLQGLAHSDLLDLVDYLSTVSGGGYIGSWLAAWVKREGELANVQQQLKPNRAEQAQARRSVGERTVPKLLVLDKEPEPIYHLRSFSSYLTPVYGFFSADTWTLFAIYLRNFTLNQLILFPAVLLGVLVAWLFVLFNHTESEVPLPFVVGVTLNDVLAVTALALLGWEFFRSHCEIGILREARGTVPGKKPRASMTVTGFLLCIFAPLLVTAILVTWLFGKGVDQEFILRLAARLPAWLDPWQISDLPWLPAVLVTGAFGSLHLLINLLSDIAGHIRRRQDGWLQSRSLFAGFVSGALGGFLFYLVVTEVYWELWSRPRALATIGPPLALLVFMVGIISEIGLMGGRMAEDEREWWSKMCAWLMIGALGWAAIVGVSVYGGRLLLQVGPLLLGLLTSGWLSTAIAGARAGWSPRTRTGRGPGYLEFLGRIAPSVFVVGLFAAVSLVVELILAPAGNVHREDFWSHFWLVAGCSAFVFLVMVFSLDANLFSLNATYANRLIRCYLGASRPKAYWRRRLGEEVPVPGRGGAPTGSKDAERQENFLTGFDPKDDLELQKLRIGELADNQPTYWGPYPLINTALNLVGGDELAWQERKAESFLLSPLYCGGESTCYRALPDDNRDLTLGRAVAISGAAASPNMGYHSSPPLTALMTVFNARLGWWLQNPGLDGGGWRAAGPAPGMLLWRELFSLTNERSAYVYLSDGGHFENLGVYELIRRRCRYIIACDAGADPSYQFQDLANLVRKCRNDFGIRIDIDPSPLKPQAPDGRSLWHCAIGTIHYDDVDARAGRGTLIYIKSSLTGDEPSDVGNFAAQHALFPHQSTADQFFTESQFESYRALGYHVAQRVVCDALTEIDQRESLGRQAVAEKLFAALRERWQPAPAGFSQSFLESTKPFIDVQQALRRDGNLRNFSDALYPQLRQKVQALRDAHTDPAVADKKVEQFWAELHLTSQLLQIMENAWLVLQLEKYFRHPMNSGWRAVFRLWAGSEPFRRHWTTLYPEYGKTFVKFCHRELDLPYAEERLEH